MLCFTLCVLEGFIETYGQVVSAVQWIQSVARCCVAVCVAAREQLLGYHGSGAPLSAKAGKAIATLNNTRSISTHNTNDG